MQLELAVRHAESGFMQISSPAQQLPVHGAQKHPVRYLVTGLKRGLFDAIYLLAVDAVARHESVDRFISRVTVFLAPS